MKKAVKGNQFKNNASYHNFSRPPPSSAQGSDYPPNFPLPHLIWAIERNNDKPRNRLVVRMRHKND